MREFIRSLAGTRTIILTTHNMDEADRLSNRVAIIDQEKILMTDTPENLKRSIGAHNTLQINLDKQIDDSTAHLLEHQFPLIGKLTTDNRQLTVQCPDPMQLMPLLLESLNKAGFHSEEIKIRENTLEDVFIQLTGKTLRS
jgi:ABC-2 type transport system ATP-binding protein